MLIRFALTDITCTVDGTGILITTANQILPFKLIADTGSERLLVTGDTVDFVLQAPGVRDGTGLTISSAATVATPRNTADDRYLLPVNAYTDAACELLQIGDALITNDLIYKDCDACLIFTPSGGVAIQSAPFTIRLLSTVYLPDMGLPTAVATPMTWLLANRVAVLAALGIVVTNDELQITCPDTAVRTVPLNN